LRGRAEDQTEIAERIEIAEMAAHPSHPGSHD
jgi:hypothetical protein